MRHARRSALFVLCSHLRLQVSGKPISANAASRAAKQYAVLMDAQDAASRDILRVVAHCYGKLVDVNGHAAVPKAHAAFLAKKGAIHADAPAAAEPVAEAPPARATRKSMHRRDSAPILRVC